MGRTPFFLPPLGFSLVSACDSLHTSLSVYVSPFVLFSFLSISLSVYPSIICLLSQSIFFSFSSVLLNSYPASTNSLCPWLVLGLSLPICANIFATR